MLFFRVADYRLHSSVDHFIVHTVFIYVGGVVLQRTQTHHSKICLPKFYKKLAN